MQSKAVRLFLRVGIGLSLSFICGYTLAYWLSPFSRRSFNRVEWAQFSPDDRAEVANDVIRHLPVGMPEADIEPLLGKPEKVIPRASLMGRAPQHTHHTLSYSLGNWSIVAFDSTFLWIHFDKDGKLIEAVIGGY